MYIAADCMLGGQPIHGSDLKTYLLMRWLGPDVLAVGRATGVYLLDFYCSGIQFYLLLNPYFCFISFYILIYMF